MIGLIVGFMLFCGNYFTCIGSITMLQALKNNSGLGKPLLAGVLANLIIMFVIFLLTRILTIRHAFESISEGFYESSDILLLLALSVTFSALIQLLGIGKTLCTVAVLFINPNFLPATIFVITATLGIALGSAWTTMLLLIPAILPMVQDFATLIGNSQHLQQLMLVSIGAIVSGSVFGTSISPIGDLLNLVTKSGKVSPKEYLKVQIQYNIPTGVGGLASFITSGFLINKPFFYCWFISLMVGLVTVITLLEINTRLDTKKATCVE
jgi:Na+/H+ antiporter NhaC